MIQYTYHSLALFYGIGSIERSNKCQKSDETVKVDSCGLERASEKMENMNTSIRMRSVYVERFTVGR